MQSGFGLLESGMVSRKNEANVIVKNMLDVTLGGVAFWIRIAGIRYGVAQERSKCDREKYAGRDIRGRGILDSDCWNQVWCRARTKQM